METNIFIIVVLLLLSGFFSASETALMSVSPAKVRTLVDAKKPGSKYLAQLKKKHHKTLITILVGNNLVNIAAASLTTVMMTDYFGSAAVGVATGVLTIIILVFGEIIPKSLATTYAKRISLWFAPFLYWLGVLLTPLIWFLDKLVKLLLRALGTRKQIQVTDEELIAMAAIGEEEGSIDEHERELIENVLEFNDIRVEEIMTPRVHMDAMPEDHSLSEAAQFIIHKTHSRIPVYRGTVDNIVSILTIKDLIKNLYEEDNTDDVTIRQLKIAAPLKVAQSTPLHELFHQFKTRRTHMAIVMDEHGGTAGLITMEDLLEELVGDIEDEADSTEARIKSIGDGVYELSGRVELDELHELTKLRFDFPEYKTISFLIIEHMGKLPRKGQSVDIKGWSFKVTKMWRQTILKVELTKLKEESF